MISAPVAVTTAWRIGRAGVSSVVTRPERTDAAGAAWLRYGSGVFGTNGPCAAASTATAPRSSSTGDGNLAGGTGDVVSATTDFSPGAMRTVVASVASTVRNFASGKSAEASSGTATTKYSPGRTAVRLKAPAFDTRAAR